MIEKMVQYSFWNYLKHDLQELLRQSALLASTANSWEEGLPENVDRFHDYSFIVFPAAKAYEGFLKHLFHDMGFITTSDFHGKRFRIGKALNPTLYKSEMKRSTRYRRLRKKLSIYDKMRDYCGGDELPNTLWLTWKECRNILFHWYPKEKNSIDLKEAEEKVQRILDSMNLAFSGCKIKRDR